MRPGGSARLGAGLRRVGEGAGEQAELPSSPAPYTRADPPPAPGWAGGTCSLGWSPARGRRRRQAAEVRFNAAGIGQASCVLRPT